MAPSTGRCRGTRIMTTKFPFFMLRFNRIDFYVPNPPLASNWSRFMCIEFLISSTKKRNDFCFGGAQKEEIRKNALKKRKEKKKWMKSCCHHQRDVRSQILSVLKEKFIWRRERISRRPEEAVKATGKNMSFERKKRSGYWSQLSTLTLTMSRENLCCSFEVERISDVKVAEKSKSIATLRWTTAFAIFNARNISST